MILIKQLAGTPGTNSENAIYGAEIKDQTVTVYYSCSTRDFRDADVHVANVDYPLEDYKHYIQTNQWKLI